MTDGTTPGEPIAAPEPVPAEPKPGGATSPDGRKLLIAVGVLIAAALIAVGIGIARKKDSGVTTTPTSPSGTAAPGTTAKGGNAGAGNCAPGSFPAIYTGEPTNLAAAKDAGYYLWNDPKGFHLRVLDTSGKTSFKGTITSSEPLSKKTFKLAPDGSGSFDVATNTATFEFDNPTTAVGLDFQVGCVATQFSVNMATKENLPWPASQIYVGKESKAVTNPVTLQRTGK